MRDVKKKLTDAWLAGDFTGNQRPIARVTLQQAGVSTYDVGYNLYTSLPFGRPVSRKTPVRTGQAFTGGAAGAQPPPAPRSSPSAAVLDGRPREMPNVLKVSWKRDADSEIASATIEFANTEPLPLGIAPQPDLDQPGYFTYNRGQSQFSVRWGHKPNEWSGLLLPDNILKTYEGYGFDPTVGPEDDPHLEQTGVWMIDKVDYNANGTITCTCRDIGRILADQIIFPPVTPKGFYPLSLTHTVVKPGFVAGKTFTKVVTTDGAHDPNHPPPDGWTGPYAPPTIAGVLEQDGKALVSITAAPQPADRRYRINGYQVRVDNVLLPQVTQVPTGATVQVTVPNLTNGDVYYVQANVIYLDTVTGQAHIGDDSNGLFARPRAVDAPNVVVGSLLLDTDADGNQNLGETHPGQVVWRYTAVGRPVVFTVVFYRYEPISLGGQSFSTRLKRLTKQVSVSAYPAGSTQVVEFMTTADCQPLTDWNILVYGSTGNVPDVTVPVVGARLADTAPVTAASPDPVRTGAGEASFRPSGGQFYFPPAKSAPPQQVSVINGGEKPVKLTYDTSSNDFYDGATDHSIAGHNPRDAFDGNAGTYFLSVGNASPKRGFAYEWVQGNCAGQTITGVTFHAVKAGYTAYISVFARGSWTSFSAHDVIPYNPALPQSHNGANVPFCETISVPNEGPHTVHMRQPIPGATKVRVTFGNLQNFGIGPYVYRAGIRQIGALTDGSVTVSGPAVDNNAPSVVKTYTVSVPPYVQAGLGQSAISGQPLKVQTSVKQDTPGQVHPVPPGARLGAARTFGAGDTSIVTPVPTPSTASTGLVYYDYTDIVKVLCAWGGFFWPQNASMLKTDGTAVTYGFGPGPFGLPAYVDPVLGSDAGRVWGDFEDTGTYGIADLGSALWDKKTLLDGIVYLREIVGFQFYIDELGSVVWKHPNIYQVGNDVATLTQQPRRTSEIITLDESLDLQDLNASLDSRNVRERVFISNTDGRTAAISQGFNPNPIGLRRVGGWTDQNFASQAECQRMADFICLRQLFTYRTDTLTIAGYPKIQVNDQVRIMERVTAETYIHYVAGISSDNDLQAGTWNYQLNTHWLGENPGDLWVFHPEDFSKETQDYLDALGLIALADSPVPTPTPQAPVTPGGNSRVIAPPAATRIDWSQERMALYRVPAAAPGYTILTDGLFYRGLSPTQTAAIIATGLVPSKITELPNDLLHPVQAYTYLERVQQ